MLFWQTAAEGEGDDAEFDVGIDVVAPWIDVPLIEVVVCAVEVDDVDDPKDETRIAATWLLFELWKMIPLPLLTKHWPGPTPLGLPAKVKAVHCVESKNSDISQYMKQSLTPFCTL